MERKQYYTEREVDAVGGYAFCPFCHSGSFHFGRGRDLHCEDCGEEWIPSDKLVASWVRRDEA